MAHDLGVHHSTIHGRDLGRELDFRSPRLLLRAAILARKSPDIRFLALSLYAAHIQKIGPIPNRLWLLATGLFLIILVLRRALMGR